MDLVAAHLLLTREARWEQSWLVLPTQQLGAFSSNGF